jgi:hypothetical protein
MGPFSLFCDRQPPLLILIVLASISGYGQIEQKVKKENLLLSTQKFSLGARLGAGMTYAHISKIIDRQRFNIMGKPGFGLSGHLTMPVMRGINFIAEAGYESSGRKMRDLNAGWVNDIHYNFITGSMGIQKILTIKRNDHPVGNFYFSIGPGLAYLLGGKGKIITPGGQKTTYKMIFNQSDSSLYSDFGKYFINHPVRNLIGVQFAIGGEIPINLKRNIQLELRANLGQTKLGNQQTTHYLNILNFSDTMNLNLKTVSLNIIYNFSFDTRAHRQGKSSSKLPARKN